MFKLSKELVDSSTQNDKNLNAFFKKHLRKQISRLIEKEYSRYLKKQRAKAFKLEMAQLKAELVALVSSPEYQYLLGLNDRKYADGYTLHFMVEYRRYPHHLLEKNLSRKQLLAELLNGDGEHDTIVFWDFTSIEFDLASQALDLENEDGDRMLKDLREGLENHWVSSMDDASMVPAVKDLMSVYKPAILICDRYNALVGEAERIAREYKIK